MIIQWNLLNDSLEQRTINIDMVCPTLYGKDNVSKLDKKKIYFRFG